jgi:hypothetical protein
MGITWTGFLVVKCTVPSCWIQFANILLRKFVSTFNKGYWSIIFFFCDLFDFTFRVVLTWKTKFEGNISSCLLRLCEGLVSVLSSAFDKIHQWSHLDLKCSLWKYFKPQVQYLMVIEGIIFLAWALVVLVF